MSHKDLSSNPFAALFPTISQAQNYTLQHSQKKEGDQQDLEDNEFLKTFETTLSKKLEIENLTKEKLEINKIIENVFLITLNKDAVYGKGCVAYYVYLDELVKMLSQQDWLDLECLNQAVFERLMLADPRSHTLPEVSCFTVEAKIQKDAVETRVVYYLFQCYCRASSYTQSDYSSTLKQCKQAAINNIRLALQHGSIYPEQQIVQDLVDIFIDEYGSANFYNVVQFFESLCQNIQENFEASCDEMNLFDTLKPFLDIIYSRVKIKSLVDLTLHKYMEILLIFSKDSELAEVFLHYNEPPESENGISYQSTLLGSLLGMTCITSAKHGPYEFFNNPSQHSQQEHRITEQNLWRPIYELNESVFNLLYSIIKLSPHHRHLVLTWIGNCLDSNAGRTKLGSSLLPDIYNPVYISDGFALNLSAILLRLCKPVCKAKSPKLLNISPYYCAATLDQNHNKAQRGLHLNCLHQETCLISYEDQTRPVENSFNFSTEIFYMTHFSLYQGFFTVHNKFLKINQSLGRHQRAYEDARNQGGENSEAIQAIKEVMENDMTQYLLMKTALLEPHNLELMIDLHLGTASYLAQLAFTEDMTKFAEVILPLPVHVPRSLSCIPEFLIETICDFMIFLRRFNESVYENTGESLSHFMTLILIFMGSRERMKNPHLRAKLAEALESLMPHKDQHSDSSTVPTYHREKLFTEHLLIKHLAETLLRVFVSIEMTGQSVAFEQKFNYRRPMYLVLKYMWTLRIHKNRLNELAVIAENTIEDVHPPIFLSFINLLINDAIFLLDEALSFMAQLRELQNKKDMAQSGALSSQWLPEEEVNFQHIGLLARFHNVMSLDTVNALEMITQEIKSIFNHTTMVDRIASMLNYFLLHLVGPKKKNLKVRRLMAYEFKPQEIVIGICKTYLNLGDSKEFCLAVSRDGRSYSPLLFTQAEQVLKKIGQSGAFVVALEELASKIQTLAVHQQRDEEILADAPEEFLDPIMSTFMKDPVKLPSSKITVDRSTIARHLLSDQTDPFNRSPLTMDMVQPDTELKNEIQRWLKERQSGRS